MCSWETVSDYIAMLPRLPRLSGTMSLFLRCQGWGGSRLEAVKHTARQPDSQVVRQAGSPKVNREAAAGAASDRSRPGR